MEIHGQHEHRALVTPAAQRNVLDAFAGTDLSRVRAIRSQLHALDEALAGLGGDAQQRAREADVLRYQVEEIANAHLEDPDEEASLRLEEDRLADAAAYRDAALEALELVDPAGEGGSRRPPRPRRRRAGRPRGLRELPRPLGHRRGGAVRPGAHAARRGRRAGRTIRSASSTCRSAAVCWPSCGASTARTCPPSSRSAARVPSGSPRSRTPRARRPGCRPSATCAVPSWPRPKRRCVSVRTQAAGSFADLVGERLGALAMAGARLEVRVASEGTGEPVELALGANVGEAVQPLARAASGGELARAMLAIRLVGLGGPQTMVFDEVDAGVGGAAALALGEALHEVGRDRQVLVVTHLAQVASQADAQISVVKGASRGRTATTATAVAGRGPGHRAVPDALGAPGQRRRPGPCP